MRILIVDDDSYRSRELKVFLSSQKYDEELIESCESTSDAKVLLRQRYFDVMILDVVLPQRTGGERAANIGLALLEQIGRSPSLKKPEKIIGITAHTEDLGGFQLVFQTHCFAVIEAQRGKLEWQHAILRALRHTRSSKLSRAVANQKISVITVHGIRTFGQWQNRLQTIVESETSGVAFQTYRYGYFSALGLLFSKARNREVRRLISRLRNAEVAGVDEHVVFCHSFGTFLVAEAFRQLPPDIVRGKAITLVLSGSVLKSNFDWSFLPTSARVINDCGLSDHILLLSAAFAPGLGMAGREGFHGFNNENLVNRYHKGGHSLFFDGDDFMTKYWLPVISETSGSICSPNRLSRTGLGFSHRQLESAAKLLGALFPWLLASGIIIVVSYLV